MSAMSLPGMLVSRPVRRRGGQPGNLSAAKSVIPALRRLRQGKPLPPKLARVTALVDREAGRFANSKGGLEYMAEGEQMMLNVWRMARTATLLILDELIERGAVVVQDGTWDLQPGLTRLSKFLSEERAALLAIGLGRRPRDVTDIALAIQQAQREGASDE